MIDYLTVAFPAEAVAAWVPDPSAAPLVAAACPWLAVVLAAAACLPLAAFAAAAFRHQPEHPAAVLPAAVFAALTSAAAVVAFEALAFAVVG